MATAKVLSALAGALAVFGVTLAHADENGAYRVDRVILSAPGWSEAPREDSPVPIALALDAADEPTNTYLHCDLQRAELPAQAGQTQARINERLVNDGDAFLAQSPTLRDFGRRVSDDVAVVDGIAVTSVTALGERSEGPDYSHVRLFIMVQADGSGLYYSMFCTLWGEANESNRSRLDAVANSLRFDREVP